MSGGVLRVVGNEESSQCRKQMQKVLLAIVPIMGTIVPIMGTDNAPDIISTTLFGKTRRAVLSLLFTHTDESFYLRQLTRVVGAGIGSVQRELKALVDAGIIKSSTRGKQNYFQANADCPVYPELKGLIIKTAGIGDILRSALAPHSDQIHVSFIYGSFARSDERKGSDIDVMVIGSVTFSDLVKALDIAQQDLGREINPTVYPPDEFKSKLLKGNHFLTSLMNEAKIFLIGDERELEKLAG